MIWNDNKQETSRLSQVAVLTIWWKAEHHATKSDLRNREAPGNWYIAYKHDERIG